MTEQAHPHLDGEESRKPSPARGSTAREVFDLHLSLLRLEAKKLDIGYLDALCVLAKIPIETIGFGVYPEKATANRLVRNPL